MRNYSVSSEVGEIMFITTVIKVVAEIYTIAFEG